MARQVLNLFLQPVPANHPPAVWIRRVDHALFAGLIVWVALDFLFAWIAWRSFGAAHPVPDGGFFAQVMGYPSLMLSQLTGGHFFRYAKVDNPAAFDLVALHCRLFPAWLLSLLAGVWVFKQGLEPWCRMRHTEGPQLIEGPEAEVAALRMLTSELGGQAPALYLGNLPICKERATRGVLMVGSPGAGKSVVLHPIIQGYIERNDRALIFDSKSDFTAAYLGGTVALMSIWDSRSHVWDIGRDCQTPADAAALAASFIPENDKDPYWTNGARMLFEGVLRSLQDQHGTNWGWAMLAERSSDEMSVFAERMEQHYKKASALISDPKSQAANNLLATVSGFTKLVDDLGRGWGDGQDSAGNMRPHFSFKDWIADGYSGRHRQVILQAGPDPHATASFASAIINVFIPALLSPAMPDDPNRTIGLILDELPAIGRIDFASAIERGRSRGIEVFCSVQDLQQVEARWSVHVRKTITSMFGTKIIFRMAPGESVQQIADDFGKARWSITAVSSNDSGSTTSVHEENRAVVAPHEIGALGKVQLKKFPLGWGIRAMVWLGGQTGDIYTIDFPGVASPKRRTPHRPAKWTRGPANPGQTPEPTRAARLREREDNGSAKQLAWDDAMTTDEASHRKAKAARKAKPLAQNQADPFADAPVEDAHTHGRLPDEPAAASPVEAVPNRIKEARKRILEEAAPFVPPPFSR